MPIRDAHLVRIGLPPGGPLGPWSSADNAASTSSMVTVTYEPGNFLSTGLETTLEASEAQDARMARLRLVVMVESSTTSLG